MPDKHKVTRKLRAILSADVKGYNFQMADGEVYKVGIINRLSYIVLSITAYLFASTIVLADGGYVWEKTFIGQAKSGGQQAIVLYFENRQTLLLQTNYDGELADFSWLIPVPAPITVNDIYEADSDVFPWIDDITAPSFYLWEGDSEFGCSCGGGSGSGSDSGYTDQDHVEVLETIFTETYEVNVLTAPGVQDLVDWLNQYNYNYPEGAETVLEDYILRSWYFLAVRVKPANPGIVIKQSLKPIQIGFETGEPVFPLMISSLSSEPETEILIHFLSDHRYRTSNVSSEEVFYTSSEESDDYKSEYQQWMKEQVDDRNGRLYFVEYAGWLPSYDCMTINDFLGNESIDCSYDVFVTRFRSYFSPELFTDDIYFEQDNNDSSFSLTIEIWTYQLFARSSIYLVSLFFLSMTYVTPKGAIAYSKRQLIRLGILIFICLFIL
jgi:hypothetical protein